MGSTASPDVGIQYFITKMMILVRSGALVTIQAGRNGESAR